MHACHADRYRDPAPFSHVCLPFLRTTKTGESARPGAIPNEKLSVTARMPSRAVAAEQRRKVVASWAAVPLAFLHIPRTAGFTLKQILEWHAGARGCLLDAHLYETDEVRSRSAALTVIEGHAAAGWFARVIGDAWPACGVTILREPVARVVSQARHLRAGSSPFRAAPWMWEGLRERLDRPESLFENMPRLSNLQTKLLATRGLDSASMDSDALRDAKDVLAEMCIGITENLVTSLAMIGERHRIDFPRISRTNASPPRGDDDLRSAAFLEAAVAHNAVDLELYAYAVDLVHDRVAAHCSGLLGLDLDEVQLDGAVGVFGRPLDAGLVAGEAPELQVRGWVLVGGEVADAVLIRVGDEVTPAACRVLNVRAAAQTRRVDARFAGVRASLRLPDAVQEIEVIAFDRARGLVARRSFPVIPLSVAKRGAKGRG